MHQTRHLVKQIPLCDSIIVQSIIPSKSSEIRNAVQTTVFQIFLPKIYQHEIYDTERINFASLDESCVCVSRFIGLYVWNNRGEQFRGNKKIISRAFIHWRLISGAFNSGHRFHRSGETNFENLIYFFLFSNCNVRISILN